MSKRFTDTLKYKKKFIRNLPSAYKIFWDYLICNCDSAGIWHVDFAVARIETGEKSISEAKALILLSQKIHVFDGGEKWFLPSFITFQYGEIQESSASKPIQSIINQLTKMQLMETYKEYLMKKSIGYPKGIDTLKDKDSVLDKESEQPKGMEFKIIPPKLEWVQERIKEKSYKIDAEKFIAYYESKGWKVGNSKMIDWGSALVTWNKNAKDFNVEVKQKSNQEDEAEKYRKQQAKFKDELSAYGVPE